MHWYSMLTGVVAALAFSLYFALMMRVANRTERKVTWVGFVCYGLITVAMVIPFLETILDATPNRATQAQISFLVTSAILLASRI